jgi:hypothetical protein
MRYHATCGRFSLIMDTDTLPPATQVVVIAGEQAINMSVSELEDLRYMIARSQEPQTRAEHERHK